MKSRFYSSKSDRLMTTSQRRLAKTTVSFCLVIAAFSTLGIAASNDNGIVAHEWGTFTSVQGGDGVLLDWRPLQTSRLPRFVYDWTKPGLNRRAARPLGLGKGSLVTLQRMETPVIYFYADKEQTVDLSVRFPKGLLTEWYPQAHEIGPSTLPPHPAFVALDNAVRKSGFPSTFSFVSTFGNAGIKDSMIHWKDLHILPIDQNHDVAGLLPGDASGSHYFAARETDAAFVRMNSLSPTNPMPEHEKFLFYRGVGSFATPLRVTMKSNDEVTLANSGAETLTHLFLLQVQSRQGQFIYLDQLQPGEQQTVQVALENQTLPLDRIASQISNAMVESLVKAGLYRREAIAMVNTWKDSWFAEEGLRVLYVLPRAWTDRTLPMKLDPQPRELVRVMIGRAEIIAPRVEAELVTQLTEVNRGNNQARERVQIALKRLGRFAEPALQRATRKTALDWTERNKLMALLYINSKTE
ncbi:MAG: hypothetical protein HY298_08345 [Verrucomicrobia bacterium]|nr:hypothetical protein [Verrucomicrobiota bacterium]